MVVKDLAPNNLHSMFHLFSLSEICFRGQDYFVNLFITSEYLPLITVSY